MAKARSARNKIRWALQRNMETLGGCIERLDEVCGVYLASENPDHALYVGQLIPVLQEIIQAHEKVRDDL